MVGFGWVCFGVVVLVAAGFGVLVVGMCFGFGWICFGLVDLVGFGVLVLGFSLSVWWLLG